jgi:RNA polymerase sigma-70 factor (ECF subfamily)
MSPTAGKVTQLLADVRRGDETAVPRLIPLVYTELHRLAASYMRRERPGHTLQATALVNEAYLKLVEQREVGWKDRVHFFSIAARVMRRVLTDHARRGGAQRRGGNLQEVSLDENLSIGVEQSETLLFLDEALVRLSKVDDRQVRIIELRFFGGLSGDETAEALGLSPRTVDREWKLAQAWLRRELTARHQPR